MAKYIVTAFGKRGNQYGPTEVQNVDELIGAIATKVQSLLNPCFESSITVEIKEISKDSGAISGAENKQPGK